jgi:hypothetical protein
MRQNTVKTRFGATFEDICGFKHCMAMLGHLGRPLSKDGVAAKSYVLAWRSAGRLLWFSPPELPALDPIESGCKSKQYNDKLRPSSRSPPSHGICLYNQTPLVYRLLAVCLSNTRNAKETPCALDSMPL